MMTMSECICVMYGLVLQTTQMYTVRNTTARRTIVATNKIRFRLCCERAFAHWPIKHLKIRINGRLTNFVFVSFFFLVIHFDSLSFLSVEKWFLSFFIHLAFLRKRHANAGAFCWQMQDWCATQTHTDSPILLLQSNHLSLIFQSVIHSAYTHIAICADSWLECILAFIGQDTS